MTPCYFGPSEAPLFGVHYPPAGPERRGGAAAGALLCYPGPEESMRVHWVYRNLTQALTRAGLHVFKFDYYGTGDSAGPAGEGSVERWRADVAAAAAELRDRAGVRSLTLVGARLGGALAATAPLGGELGLTVDALVLWDPVAAGPDYVAELTALQALRLKRSRYPLERLLSAHEPELLGYPFKRQMAASLAGLDLLAAPLAAARRVILVESAPQPGLDALAARLAAHAPMLHREVVDDPCQWTTQEVIDAAILPNRLAARLAELVGGPP